ncbi:MAG: transposase zinc-binding domain-containing protein [Thaumarchaeota archaeon]|nr:transposase zinc-binding domain-containing protein [Nitrososphaerota archaeon]
MRETAYQQVQKNINTQPFTLRHLFQDNHNWDNFFLKHKNELRDVELKEVQKMLHCGTDFFWFQCPNCGNNAIIHLGCNSRLCTHCGKKYTDKWAAQVAKNTFDVAHRHVVFTIAKELRQFFSVHRGLYKELMDCVIDAISDVMNYKRPVKIRPGIVLFFILLARI